MAAELTLYAARLEIDYPERLDRLTTLLRIIWIIPIALILGLLTNPGRVTDETTGDTVQAGGGIVAGLFAATLLMILFRQRYPRWWFDFARELTRLQNRVGAYFLLLTDQYPSTVEEQAVHLEIDYPDVERDLNRWMPLVKWFLAIPHYIVWMILAVGVLVVVIITWFAILFTGRYAKTLFDYVVGTMRYGLRIQAYVLLLVTDKYPPFSLR